MRYLMCLLTNFIYKSFFTNIVFCFFSIICMPKALCMDRKRKFNICKGCSGHLGIWEVLIEMSHFKDFPFVSQYPTEFNTNTTGLLRLQWPYFISFLVLFNSNSNGLHLQGGILAGWKFLIFIFFNVFKYDKLFVYPSFQCG